MRAHWRSVACTIFVVLALSWLVGCALVVAFFPEQPLLIALLVGACLSPTDPVLSAGLVRGAYAEEHIPVDLRNLISAESAANDGLALPLVLLPILLLQHAAGDAVGIWVYNAWLFQVALSVVVGVASGSLVALIYNIALARKWWDRDAQVASLIALAIAVTGALDVFGSDGILGAFAAGVAFGVLQAENREGELSEREHAIDAIEILATHIFFVFLGSVLPWGGWAELGVGRLVLCAVCVTLLRRVPVVLLLHAMGTLPVFPTVRDALLAGTLGPIGVAAVFWSALSSLTLSDPSLPIGPSMPASEDAPYLISTFMVLAHVVIFSGVGPAATGIYARSRQRERLRGAAAAAAALPGAVSEDPLQLRLHEPVAAPALPGAVSEGPIQASAAPGAKGGADESVPPHITLPLSGATSAASDAPLSTGGSDAPHVVGIPAASSFASMPIDGRASRSTDSDIGGNSAESRTAPSPPTVDDAPRHSDSRSAHRDSTVGSAQRLQRSLWQDALPDWAIITGRRERAPVRRTSILTVAAHFSSSPPARAELVMAVGSSPTRASGSSSALLALAPVARGTASPHPEESIEVGFK